MKVTLTYFDQDSFTVEEVVKRATDNYGPHVNVEVMPESTIAYDHIHFGLLQLVTHRQLSYIFSKDGLYQENLQKLRAEVLYKVSEIIDQVIIDNEQKVAS